MNLVDQIKGQLNDGMIDQLSSLIGVGEGQTKSAIGAAVPGLLQALSGVASSEGGAQKVASALNQFDAGSLGNLAGMFTQNPNAVQQQGGSLLSSIFGGSIVSGIADAISRYTGIPSGAVQKLLSYLMPMIMGAIAGRFAGKSLNPHSLMSFFSEQKSGIANALPSGFSLKSVPGLTGVTTPLKEAAGAAQATGSSALKWLLPVAGLALLALLVGYLLWPKGNAPVLSIPNAADVTTNLSTTFKSMTDSLSGITDAASADKAAPKLRDLSAKLDGLKASIEKLPADAKAKATAQVKADMAKLEEQYARMAWMPGVGEKIKTQMNETLGKMAAIADVPVPQFPQLSSEMADTFTSITQALNGIKDKTSAEAALPKLKDINTKLEGLKESVDKLPDGSKDMLRNLIKAAIVKVREVVDRVVAQAGVGETVKPTLDAMMEKLNTFVA